MEGPLDLIVLFINWEVLEHNYYLSNFMEGYQTATITKQKIATRTLVTIGLALLGAALLAIAATSFTSQNYGNYANYSNNQAPANNQSPIPPKPAANIKDLSKYKDKEIFLISDKNWQDVLPLVPLTTWTGQSNDLLWCRKGYGTPANVCVYPTLIFHEEATGFDADSAIYFMQQYQTDMVTWIGEIPQALFNLLIAKPELGAGLFKGQFKKITSNDYLSYWKDFKDVVYVENNYELALMASTYASLLNAPLIIQGTSSDSPNTFYQRNVICAGSATPIGASCSRRYTLDQLQNDYLKKTLTDKIILVNPNDLTIKVTEQFTPEKSTGAINEIYSRTSLAAPILASAKKELILSTKSINYQEVDSFIESKIKNLGIKAEYLTIVASPDAIEMDYPDRTSSLYLPPDAWWYYSSDAWYYSKIDNDPFLDLAVGRIFGITMSDSSSNIARSIFYKNVLKNEDNVLITRGLPFIIAAARVYVVGKALSAIGYKTTMTPVGTTAEDWKNKFFISYDDHGTFDWAGIYSSEIPLLDNSFVMVHACGTCRFRIPRGKGNLFCANIIRRGGIGYIGTVDLASYLNQAGILSEIFAMNETIGKAFVNSKNAAMVKDNNFDNHIMPWYTLIGDPTLNLKIIHNFPKPELTISSKLTDRINYKLIIPAMKFEIPQWVIDLMETKDEYYIKNPYYFTTSFNKQFDVIGGKMFTTRFNPLAGFIPGSITYGWRIDKELSNNGQEYVWITSPPAERFDSPYFSYFSEANDYEFKNFEFEITLYSE